MRMQLAIAGAALVLAAGGTFAQSASVVVHADKPGARISPMLYGLFFEEINLAGDGGIYAELVRNRSFDDADEPVHWMLVGSAGSQGSITIDTHRPLSQVNRRSLRLHIADAAGGRLGVTNRGYHGLSITAGERYTASLYAKCGNGFAGALTIGLESADGRKYAEQSLNDVTSEWKQFTTSLSPSATDANARLVISASGKGTVWLDMLSLFPVRTWKNRPNGLRCDLAGLLDELRPSFVRFPGGCWVEGDTLATAYRWKATIGDVKDRPGRWNLWQYQCSNGLGFHEYLQMCEDLGAEPLFVINCGMSHRENVPLEGMAEWINDALDAIEYANGPASSTWGAQRAKNGHLAPFGLKYIEIGNENGGAAYNERYALFSDAIKAKYPQIRLIANEWQGRPSSRPIDIIDEHYYADPAFFVTNADRYDRYDRKGSKVYVGEYAVVKSCGTGNLRAAVAEAAFMTGMERNADVVVMASYAPLFAHVEHRTWVPNLINFNASHAYGTPSYHVQKMFSTNRGDVILPAEVTVPMVALDTAGGPASSGKAVHASASLVSASGEIILKLVNVADVAQETSIDLAGLKGILADATAVVLSSKSPQDENSLTRPTNVHPVTQIIHPDAPRFRHTLPPHSVTILRLKPRV